MAFAAVWLLRVAVVDIVVVTSDSMTPTACAGDRLLVQRAGAADDVVRGDLVTFRSPDDGEATLKRVVAVGGETLAIRDAVLYVDGQAWQEPYVDRDSVDGSYFGPVRVPVDAVFLMGDEREFSVDSRDYGAVPLTAIDGKVLGRLWSRCSG
ncbi:MAG: signal peptidase I [Nocardioides sp.]